MSESTSNDVHRVAVKEYSAASLTLALAGVGLLFSLLVIFRVAWSDREEEDIHGKQGRRLRKILVICLLGSDFVIALGSVGPAAMVYRGLSLAGPQCNASGITLALGLWWQYAFSLLIALTTYLSLRHPLSRMKRLIDSQPIPLVAFVLSIGIIQAVLWHFEHGYDGGHGFCYYGRPAELGSELMQFLPRLITSLGITAIYIPLIGFLRRPDSGSAYLGSSLSGTGGRSREATPCRSFDGERGEGEDDVPPWEKLSFPTYTWDDKIKGIRIDGGDANGGGMKRGSKLFGVTAGLGSSMSMKLDSSPAGTLRTYSSRQGLLDHSHSLVQFTLPANPQPAVLNHTLGTPSLALLTDLNVSSNATSTFQPPRPKITSRPSTAPATLAPHPQSQPQPRALSRIRHAHTPSACTLASISDLAPTPLDTNADGPRVSFLNMIAYTPPTPEFSHRRTRSRSSTLVEMVEGKLGVQRTRSRSRSLSPEVEEVMKKDGGESGSLETMASYMRRRTSYYLWCFPLTHLIICIITIIRFTYFAARRVDDITVDALTLVVVIGQGLADIIIFGLVEHRTRQSYKREVASCMGGPKASLPEEEGMETLPTPVTENPLNRIA